MMNIKMIRLGGWGALFSVIATFTIIGLLFYFFWKIIIFIVLFIIGLLFIGGLSRRMNQSMLSKRMNRNRKRENKNDDVIDVKEYKVE